MLVTKSFCGKITNFFIFLQTIRAKLVEKRMKQMKRWMLTTVLICWQDHYFRPSCQIRFTRQQANCHRVTLFMCTPPLPSALGKGGVSRTALADGRFVWSSSEDNKMVTRPHDLGIKMLLDEKTAEKFGVWY